MDEVSQKRFDAITQKEIVALTEPERRFLRARSSYLNPVQKEVYAEVLEDGNVEAEPVDD